ncbi:55.5 kDa and 49.5 kDa sporulation protein [Actinoplanes sp. SE50]|uniref:hypothetical protein n=1 Tax=unclassified Actinoplanes TaxID=2626549 RepID=UPI00023ECD66|nr:MULTISPECIES: hypothetical protein [unclassified Actinoplanes]AEV87175.1 55.5 kDa and 49.5 kDa sporulation protein [Actinoplanes sp. SE50/110]ATO85576.1 55.5 kDa and 49.5 kDa sporulation protein [Actinoplanes sp. SE50]SLM02989.1 hypothetical protein ACSP50_6274 [Actinoplanes sp. SE50/110]
MTPLRLERQKLGWSRTRLAHELERRAQGRFSLATRASLLRMISAWESGARDTSDPYRTLLCEAYGRTADELGLGGGTDRAESSVGLSYASSLDAAAAILSDLARFDDMKHPAVSQGRYQPDALNAVCLDWLFGTASNDMPAGAGKRVTMKDVEEIRATTSMFDSLDRRFGGENARSMAVRFLREAVLPRFGKTSDQTVTTELYRAAAILCELIGWMSFDTSRNSLAQRYFTQALRLAEAAGDRAYASYILASMADQALFLKRPDQALRLAQVARDAGEKAGVAVATTEASMLEARAFAAQGDESGCTRALLRAEAAFNSISADDNPSWANHWGDILFASHAGTCWVDLGAPKEAASLVRTVWDSAKDQARRRVYSGVQLARVALLTNEVEQAVSYGIAALEATSGLTSNRSLQQLRDLRDQLGNHAKHPAVVEFEERARLVLAA